MKSIADIYSASFRFSDNLLADVTDDLSEEDAIVRLRDGEGPSILWTLGHMLHYRCRAIFRLGGEENNSYNELFNNAGASDGEGYPTLATILEEWRTTAAQLAEALEKTADERMSEADESGRSLLNVFTFLTWHEASHFGTINTIRKELGYKSASEHVIERIRKQQAEAS